MKSTLTIVAAVILLCACSTNPHADAGKRLSAEGKHEQALSELEQAAKDEPNNLEARSVLERTRALLANRYVVEGETARIIGQPEAARSAFKRALTTLPGYPRAEQGLNQIEIDRSNQAMLGQAIEALKKDDFSTAEKISRTVLMQDSTNQTARQLLKDTDRRRASSGGTSSASIPALTKKVTMEFRAASIQTVFELLSRDSGINFVFDKDVRPDIKVTIVIRNGTVDDIMKLVLASNQLSSKRLSDNAILIFPNSSAKNKDYQELVTKNFYLTNTDVKQAQALVKQIVKTKDMFIDERLNLLVMKDTPEAVLLAEKLIESLDIAEPEVMLEVEVLEVSRNKLLDLGLQYPDQIGYGKITPDIINQVLDVAGNTISKTTTFGGALAPGNIDLRNRTGLTSYVTNPAVLLNLKDQDGSSRILANPRIRVKNRGKAKILIGDKVPVFTTTSTANVGVSASVSYLDVGLKLEVEPNVSLDDDVSIKVGLEVSSIAKEIAGPAGSLAYQIGTRNAETILRLRNGETQVLAGLINDEERSTAAHLPGLGDIPLVGRLFSTQRDSSNKTEIVLLITPRIVRNLVRPEATEPTTPAGTDGAVGMAPLKLSLTTSLSMRSSGGAISGASETNIATEQAAAVIEEQPSPPIEALPPVEPTPPIAVPIRGNPAVQVQDDGEPAR